MRYVTCLAMLLIATFLQVQAVSAQESTPAAGNVTGGNGTVSAEFTVDDEDFVLRVNESAFITPDQVVDNVAVISGDLRIAGHVREDVFVVDGDVSVTGTVDGSITVISGTLDLAGQAVVNDLNLIDTDLSQGPNTVVSGEIKDEDAIEGAFKRTVALIGLWFWGGMTLLALVAAALFTWLSRKQLLESSQLVSSSFVKSLLTALFVFIAVPIIAILILFTIIGIPLSLATLMAVLPGLWILGAIVFGTFLMSFVLKPAEHGNSFGRMLATALLGTLLMMVALLIPVVGLISILAGMLGAGAFVYRSVRNATRDEEAETPVAAPAEA